MVVEPSTNSIKAFAWKIQAPQKIHHLIWKLVSGYIAVIGNLTRRHIHCDNYCPKCGEPDESANHTIFECAPALQTWVLASTPSCPGIFPTTSIFSNLDYLFWRKNEIEDPSLDKDPYPWIIWFLWKMRNEKLFRGISRDLLELVRHVESKCNAWFEENAKTTEIDQAAHVGRQDISLQNICLVDGTLTAEADRSEFGWVWKDCLGNEQLLGLWNKENSMSSLHTELEALIWAMESMIQNKNCQHFRTDCMNVMTMIQNPEDWPRYSTKLVEFVSLSKRLLDFKISYIPRIENRTTNGLTKIARNFYRQLVFVGCYIPVWIPKPP